MILLNGWTLLTSGIRRDRRPFERERITKPDRAGGERLTLLPVPTEVRAGGSRWEAQLDIRPPLEASTSLPAAARCTQTRRHQVTYWVTRWAKAFSLAKYPIGDSPAGARAGGGKCGWLGSARVGGPGYNRAYVARHMSMQGCSRGRARATVRPRPGSGPCAGRTRPPGPGRACPPRSTLNRNG